MMRIGIDLGGTKIEAVALSCTGETLFQKRIPTPRSTYAALSDAEGHRKARHGAERLQPITGETP